LEKKKEKGKDESIGDDDDDLIIDEDELNTIPDDTLILEAFKIQFPSLYKFACRLFHFDKITLRNSSSPTSPTSAFGTDYNPPFTRLEVELPFDQAAMQAAYPKIWHALSGIAQVLVTISDKDGEKILCDYEITRNHIRFRAVVAGPYIVWRDADNNVSIYLSKSITHI
jgi:hypothetical protein